VKRGFMGHRSWVLGRGRVHRLFPRPRTQEPRNPCIGFTLLAVRLAVTITAILMSILYAVVVATINAQARVEAEINISEIGPSLVSQIRQDIEAAFQPDGEGEFFVGLDRPGRGDRLDFVASVMAYGSEDDYTEASFHSVNEVGYQVMESLEEPGVGILYRRLDYFVDEDPLRGGRLVELYNRVRSFEVTYFTGEDWVTSWATKDNGGRMPQAVRIELKLLLERREDQDVERTYIIIVPRTE